MSSTMRNKLAFGSLLVGTCAVLCLAIVAQAQYNTFDSDSNSDSEGGPILTNSEIGRLVRNSARNQHGAASAANLRNSNSNRNYHQSAAATRNLYNKQQPLQYAPTQHRRQYGSSDGLSGYSSQGPVMGASHGRGASANNNDDDDDESGNFGPNFNANFDNADNDGETNANSNADGQPMNLNQAASGYPGQGDYSENAAAFGAGFGGASGYGPSLDGAEFGPSSEFGSEGRRAKSASSLMGSRGFGSDDDAGAPQYGPNSAVNSGDNEDEGRAGYAPEGGNDNDADDE